MPKLQPYESLLDAWILLVRVPNYSGPILLGHLLASHKSCKQEQKFLLVRQAQKVLHELHSFPVRGPVSQEPLPFEDLPIWCELEEPGSLALNLVKKLEYGLKLVKDRAGVEDFVITGEAVTDMEKYINDLVKKYYQEEYKYQPAEITENKIE